VTDKPQDAAADLLIKEVDEDLRQEKLAKAWKRHGPLFTGAAVALVLAVAGWQAWNAWDGRQRQAASARLDDAVGLIEQGRLDEAADALTLLAAEGTSGYRLIASLRLADLRQQQGNVDEAVRLYRRLADDESLDHLNRDMVRIRLGYLTLDSADPAAIDRAIEPLAAESSPWRHSAREIQALVALRRGDAVRANELFSGLAEDTAAPRDLRLRAAEMLAATGRADRS
jgi:hypothetical protein